MEASGRIRIVSAAVVVSIAIVTSFVTSTAVASRAYLRRGEQAARQARSLDVTGSAKARITSDLALWDIMVAGEGKTLEEAFKRLDASAGQVREFLSRRAFAPESITSSPIYTSVHHLRDPKGNETREIASYELSRTITIKSAEVEKVARSAGEVTELLKSGAHVVSRSPSFVYTRLADLKIRMLGEATANARQRAERIAQESRCRIGAVREARAGVLQITPPWSTEVSAGGMNDTSSIEKDVTSVMHLTLTIESE